MLVKPLVRPIVRAIAGRATDSLGSGFSPVSLFSGTDKGYIFDNNDLSSFYLDSAGTTAATVNGLVGLQLDKSQGLVLGADIVTNGGFDTDSSWVKNAGWTISGGTANAATAGTSSLVQGTAAAVAGKWYRITFTVVSLTSGAGFAPRVGAAVGATVNTAGTFTQYLLSTSTETAAIIAIGAVTGSIDNVIVRELPGNHRYQTTTGSKPILRGTPVGGNIVTNGDFASGTGWTLGAGVNISGGTLNVDGTVSQSGGIVLATPTTPFAVAIGRVYRIEWRLVSYSSTETISIQIGGASGAARSAAGTFVEYLTATTTGQFNIITRGAPATRTATIDNIVIHDVSADAVTAPYALQMDGIDDFLTTASVDFTASDKMAVVMGVRKLSDAATGIAIELSASGATGSFYVGAPQGAAANYSFRAGGSIFSSGTSASSYPSPNTSVLSGLADISGDSLSLRINGTQVATSASDQGTGNFRNDILYFGRRGGASLPMNGLDFGGICVNKTLTASQLSSAERWTAIRTGVTI